MEEENEIVGVLVLKKNTIREMWTRWNVTFTALSQAVLIRFVGGFEGEKLKMMVTSPYHIYIYIYRRTLVFNYDNDIDVIIFVSFIAI